MASKLSVDLMMTKCNPAILLQASMHPSKENVPRLSKYCRLSERVMRVVAFGTERGCGTVRDFCYLFL